MHSESQANFEEQHITGNFINIKENLFQRFSN